MLKVHGDELVPLSGENTPVCVNANSGIVGVYHFSLNRYQLMSKSVAGEHCAV